MEDTYLQHHGVLGMKWGRRKARTTSSKSSRHMSADAREAYNIKKKKVSEMSNQELQKLNNRQNLERSYKQNNKGRIAKGMRYAAATAATMGTVLALYNNSNNLINIGKKTANSLIKKTNGMALRRAGDYFG